MDPTVPIDDRCPPVGVGRAPDVPLIRLVADVAGRRRAWSGAVALGCGVVLGVAAWLTPSPTGMETHRQLGLAPCGFLYMTGMPCPTCGMTTAFAWLVHGHPVCAFMAQPLGALLCVACVAALIIGTWTALTGRALQVDWVRISPAALVVGLGFAFFAGWGLKLLIGLQNGQLPWKG